MVFKNFPPAETNEANALSEALNAIDDILPLRYIVALTASGYSARLAAAERPKAPVLAMTPDERIYHRLNLVWGVKPLLVKEWIETFEEMLHLVEQQLKQRNLVDQGDRILIMGGLPMNQAWHHQLPQTPPHQCLTLGLSHWLSTLQMHP